MSATRYHFKSNQAVPMRALELATNAQHNLGSGFKHSKRDVESRSEMVPDPDHVEAFWFNALDGEWRMWTQREAGNFISFFAPHPLVIEAMLGAEDEARSLAASIEPGPTPARTKQRI